MILSCPSCSTRYSVDEATLGPEGRKVRCASCAHIWHVTPEAAAPAPAQPEPEPETLQPVPKDPAQAYRGKVEARRKRRHTAIGLGAWGAVAASLIVMLGAAWVFRLDVVRAMPQTASAYALIGSKANAFGMTIEEVAARRVLVEGEPVLEVEGVLRNIDRRPRETAYVRFALESEAGEEIFAWTVRPERESLAPGESVAVVAQLVNPPRAAANVELTLAEDPLAIDDPDIVVEEPAALTAPETAELTDDVTDASN